MLSCKCFDICVTLKTADSGESVQSIVLNNINVFNTADAIRRGATAAFLLELQVRIPSGAWMFMLCVVQ